MATAENGLQICSHFFNMATDKEATQNLTLTYSFKLIWPADTEQHQHSFGVVFLSTSNIRSPFSSCFWSPEGNI